MCTCVRALRVPSHVARSACALTSAAGERERERLAPRAVSAGRERLQDNRPAMTMGEEAPQASGDAVEVAKQLDFYAGDDVPSELKPVVQASTLDELKAAQATPSYETFKSAFDKVVEVTEARIEAVKSCAAGAAASGGGEGALRRLRDHFRSLKGSFMSLDTKEAFMEALQAGRPDGTESSLLTQAQSATAQSAEELRRNKRRKSELNDNITETIEGVCEEHAAFDAQKSALAAILSRLDSAMRAYDDAFAEYNACGPNASAAGAGSKDKEEGLRDAIAEAKRGQANREQRLAQQRSQAREVEAEVEALRARVASARAQLADASAASAGSPPTAKKHRMEAHKTWLREQMAVMAAISGCAIVAASERALSLRLTTRADDAGLAMLASSPGQSAAATLLEGKEFCHTLAVEISATLPPTVASVTLRATNAGEALPPHADLVRAAVGAAPSCVPALVHALRARLASWHVRPLLLAALPGALPQGAQAEVGKGGSEGGATEVAVRLAAGTDAVARLSVPLDWPRQGAKLQLAEVVGDPAWREEHTQAFCASERARGGLIDAVATICARPIQGL